MHLATGTDVHRPEMGWHMTRCIVVPTMSMQTWAPTMVQRVHFHAKLSLRRSSIRATLMRITLIPHNHNLEFVSVIASLGDQLVSWESPELLEPQGWERSDLERTKQGC